MNNPDFREPTLLALVIIALAFVGVAATASAQTSDQVTTAELQTGPGFTFQGQLRDNDSPVNDHCDIQAGLWDAETDGALIGGTQTVNNVSLQDGRFTITLNAGNEFSSDAFTGQMRWLQIAVRCPTGSGNYAILQPRQPLTAAPYAQSLLPGAVISGNVGAPTNAILSLHNSDTSGVGLRIVDTNLDGVVVDNAGRDGFTISVADDDGLEIDLAGQNGVEVNESANAFWAGTPKQDGLYVQLAGFNGLDVTGYNLAGYFGGAVQVTGGCTGCFLASFGINTSQRPLEPGDVVIVTGSHLSRVDSTPLLLEVAQANGQGAVVGVVMGRAEEVDVENPRPDEMGRRLIPREGPAQPSEFVTIVTYGLAPVRVGTANTSLTIGQRLTAGEDGRARSMQTVQVSGVTVNEAAPTLGIALEAGDSDGDGLVWVLVNPQ